MACCASDAHPNDWWCKFVWTLPQCPRTEGLDDSFKSLQKRYQELLDHINATENNPPVLLMLGLADLLVLNGDYAAALKAVKKIENKVGGDFSLLARIYHIQGDAYSGLSADEAEPTVTNRENARAAYEMASQLLDLAQTKLDLG